MEACHREGRDEDGVEVLVSREEDLLEALTYFATSIRTSMLYMARRVEALEEAAAKTDPFFRVPDLTEEEKEALAEAKAL
jgi:hypothetical protein